MKSITFSNYKRCEEVATSMNQNHEVISDNATRGTTYYTWVFSKDTVVLVHAHGEGKEGSRFQNYFLIKGTAHKVGRDRDNLEFYNESITVK